MNYINNISGLSDKDQKIIFERIKIIEFLDKFGEKATQEAFTKSRSTVFLWKQKLKQNNGRLSALKPQSKSPKNKRKREADPRLIDFILKYRQLHPGASKETVKYVLNQFCLIEDIKVISESTIGRIIADLKAKDLLPKTKKLSYYARTGKLIYRETRKIKKLRRKDFKAKQAGDLVQIDAIEIFHLGVKRYILTAIDIYTKFAFAYAYKSLSSSRAKDFIQRLQSVAPFTITRIQTDNGKEFHKYFEQYINSQDIVHFWNYPRCPKMNSFIENFNGTIQKQYIDWHYDELDDPQIFNQGLMEYLLWYNTEKPHSAIGKIPPLRYYVNTLIESFNLPTNLIPQKSNMLWTSAKPSNLSTNLILLRYGK